MLVLDHTEREWSQRYAASGRENGAATYSREIVEHHLPVWRDVLPDDSLVSTCRLLDQPDLIPDVRMVVQYLHTYPYDRPFDPVRRVRSAAGDRAVVFVSAYRSFVHRIRAAGERAIHVPMAVDPRPLAGIDRSVVHGHGRAVYYGNVTRPKQRVHQSLVRAFRRAGWTLDTISNRDQRSAWAAVAAYQYGVGVGRCALELMELGVQTMIAGAEFGGLITTPGEFDTQLATNLNGRVVTFDRSPAACIAAFDLSLVPRRDYAAHLASLTDLFREAVA